MKMLDYAKMNHIPVWTELTWLRFLEAKDAASFDNIHWTDNQLTFDIHSDVAFERNLAFLIPRQFNHRIVKDISSAGKSLRYDVVTIKGVSYARVLCQTGSDTHVEVQYQDLRQ